MKNQVFLPILFLFTFLAYQVQAQCPAGNITLVSQADVDLFVATYPACQALPGGLHIGTTTSNTVSDITDLSGLQLTSIGGDLRVQNNAVLLDLDGLDMLTSVSGGVTIFNNDALTDVGLSALASIGKNLSILNNDGLTGITGLSTLTSIGTSLSISFNPMLTSLVGLEGITSINGFVSIESNGITSMAGLDNLGSVGGDFDIKNNTSLLSLDGLEGLMFVSGNFYLFANIQLTSIMGLVNLVDVCGNFQIFKNYNLTECAVGILCKFVQDPNFDLFLDESMPTCGTVESIEGILSAANVDCVTAEAEAVLCSSLSTELVNLEVRLEGRTTVLVWETATETNNQGFDIQRSRDGFNWETIGWQEGSGTSNATRSYTYRDYNTYRGINYYRLQQMDFNGASSYSQAVSISSAVGTIDIYPNPANEFFVVSGLDGRTIDEITIHDVSGKEMIRLTDANNRVDISNLQPGMYVAVVIAGFEEKFIKLFIE